MFSKIVHLILFLLLSFSFIEVSLADDLQKDFAKALKKYEQEQDRIKTVYCEGRKEGLTTINTQEDQDFFGIQNDFVQQSSFIWNYQKDGVYYFQNIQKHLDRNGTPHPEMKSSDGNKQYIWNGDYTLWSHTRNTSNNPPGYHHQIMERDMMGTLLRPHDYLKHFTYIYGDRFQNMLKDSPEKIEYNKVSNNNKKLLHINFPYVTEHSQKTCEVVLSYEYDLKPLRIHSKTMDGTVERTIRFENYQPINDIYFPFTRKSITTHSEYGVVAKSQIEIDKLEFNSGLNQELFTPDFKVGQTIDHVELKTHKDVQEAKEKYRVDINNLEK